MQNSFNENQIKAINSYDTPLLILAGAGTGKTLTVTTRIANLILNDICPAENILAVTFTNKAANEMKTRIEKLVKEGAEKMWVGTFHGISARILRIYAKALGLAPNFLILDENDRKKLLTNVIHEVNIDEKRFPIKVCQFIISRLKELCIDPNDVDKLETFKYRDLDITNLYQTYQHRLRGMNAVDFDDLIFECVRLFKREPKILSDLQNRFRYITVDEYQDTNEIQHLWLQLLANNGANVCCVGDEDQSIYSWRGAKVEYILNFSKDFLGAQIIRLEQNYRSTQYILDAAMSVILNNKQRYDKTLKSNIVSQKKPNLVLVENDIDENNNIVKYILQLQKEGVNLKDMAILVRAAHQMRSIEDFFIKNKIPYKIIGGIRFYDRKEIKDLIAYIRWCYSLVDVISLERIINLPKRGIGEKSFSDIMLYIKKNDWCLFDGLQNVANFSGILNAKSAEQLRHFIDFTNDIHDSIVDKKIPLANIVEEIYNKSGYSKMLEEELKEDEEATTRIDNIREFIASIEQFDSIDQFLEHISLVSANDDESSKDSVNIMTMHAAKGLEFPYVFLPAWEEGIFPSQKSIDDSGTLGIEEERRLAYVALTRAKKNFFVFAAKQRLIFGKKQFCQQSRFINEMQDKLDVVNLTYYRSQCNAKNYDVNLKQDRHERLDKNKNYECNNACNSGTSNFVSQNGNTFGNIYCRSTNPFVEAEMREKQFKIGDVVYSDKFGEGVVMAVYGKFYDVKFANTKQITKDIYRKKS